MSGFSFFFLNLGLGFRVLALSVFLGLRLWSRVGASRSDSHGATRARTSHNAPKPYQP